MSVVCAHGVTACQRHDKPVFHCKRCMDEQYVPGWVRLLRERSEGVSHMQIKAAGIKVGDHVTVNGAEREVIERTETDDHVYIVYVRGEDGRRTTGFAHDEVVTVSHGT